MCILELLEAALFVNVAVSLALLANLDQCGNGEDKDGIDAWSMLVIFFFTWDLEREQRTNHAKEGGKDDVESNVGKARDGSRTSAE